LRQNVSARHDQIIEAVRERDGDACIICGQWAEAVHHICPRSMLPGPRLDGALWDMRNVCLLCVEHHGDNRHTGQGKRECLARMEELYHYDYGDMPWRWYR